MAGRAGCTERRRMTKREKLRAIIERDVKSGFVYEMERQLRTHAPYIVKLNGHPGFMADVIDMIVQDQLPFYETVSDAGVDAAYEFFMSPAGAEWCMLSAKFVNQINQLTPGWIKTVMKRLSELN
jgi:hypothetical protein